MTDDQFTHISFQLQRIAIALENSHATRKQRAPREPATDGGAIRLMEVWNERRNILFSKVQGLGPTSARYKNAAARWKEKPDVEYWFVVIGRINNSKFCSGDNDRGWVADFEFLVRPDTHYKVMEGKYDFIGISQKNNPMTKKTGSEIVGYTNQGEPVYG